VVADQRAPIKGRFVADVGFYDPHTDVFKVDKEKVQEWISNGAKPTATVNNLLVENKMIEGEKVTSWKPKKKKDEEGEERTTEKKEQPKKDDKEGGGKEEEKKKVNDNKEEEKEEKKEGKE